MNGVEWNRFAIGIENVCSVREENVGCALDKHPRSGGFRSSMIQNDTHHPLIARIEGNLEDFLVFVRKKWQHVSGIVQRKTFME